VRSVQEVGSGRGGRRPAGVVHALPACLRPARAARTDATASPKKALGKRTKNKFLRAAATLDTDGGNSLPLKDEFHLWLLFAVKTTARVHK
jgi:hypothetical protein